MSTRFVGRRLRFRRRIRRNARGVVSVVGTLLALLVFFALFGVFLTQYLPLWMSEDEEALAVQVETSLADFKYGMDGQAALGGPALVSTPIPLVSQSIPLLTQPTSASIVFAPPGTAGGPYGNYSISPAPGSTNSKTALVQNVTIGSLKVSIPSRYYSPQTFSVEDDAVVQTQQSSQQILEFPPSLSINVSASGFGVTAVLVVISGVSAAANGGGTQELFSHFVFTQTFTATSSSHFQNASFIEGTHYPCAWYNFTATTLSLSSPAGFGSHYTLPTAPPSSACTGQSAGLYPFKMKFTNLASFKLIYAEVRLVLGVGSE